MNRLVLAKKAQKTWVINYMQQKQRGRERERCEREWQWEGEREIWGEKLGGSNNTRGRFSFVSFKIRSDFLNTLRDNFFKDF